jgi:hypothetical protein
MFSMTNHEGGRVERFISIAAVKEAFTGVPIDSGWLDPRIVRWQTGRFGESCVAFFPPQVYELELTRENAGEADTPYTLNVSVDHVRTPLPGLVFFGVQAEYYIWASKSPELNPHFEIYRCPLPNVEVDGKICWGPFKPPRCSAKAIFEAFELFIKSTFNNHRANGKSKAQREDVRLMLRETAKEWADPEPSSRHARAIFYWTDDLIRQVEHTGVTLDKAIRGFFETGAMPS